MHVLVCKFNPFPSGIPIFSFYLSRSQVRQEGGDVCKMERTPLFHLDGKLESNYSFLSILKRFAE